MTKDENAALDTLKWYALYRTLALHDRHFVAQLLGLRARVPWYALTPAMHKRLMQILHTWRNLHGKCVCEACKRVPPATCPAVYNSLPE